MNDRGGGMYLSSASPTVINCNFTGNIASNVAGALWLAGSAPTFIGCEFKSNFLLGGNAGAAIHNVFESDLTLIDCVFQDNTLGTSSTGGGAMFVSGNILGNKASSVVAQSCIFVGNNGSSGGAILNNGFADFSNCLFVGNVALGDGFGDKTGKGGAIANFGVLTISNSTFAANSAIEIGGAIYAGHMTGNTELDSVIAVDNCVLWGNTGAGSTEQQQIGVGDPDVFVNYSCIQGLTGKLGGTGNIGDNPLYVDRTGPDGIPGTGDEDLRLLPGSPGIDAADNTAVPKGIDTDLDGNPRFVDDPDTDDTGFGDPPIVDMGAYEFQVMNCPWDVNGDGVVDHHDIVEVVHNLGPCNDPDNCPWDVNGDGIVNGRDVAAVAMHFGPCP
ncbi:MAG: hypothetical protein IIB53_14280 [Planctomycetes bacterium]|nr:hypothetical protein [Planctomycetota bacterium]